ncbi:AAA family ATPase [Enterobacter hormaechei]
MSRTIMLIPTGTSVGLTSVSLGVIRAMERKGVRLSVFNLSPSHVPVAMRQTRPPPSFARTPICQRLNR